MERKTLTNREMDVLECLIKGLSNKQIAKELVISVHTVKALLESIYFKLDVHSRVQAIIKAINEGIIVYNPELDMYIRK